jgi:hypothetical protein
VLTIELAKAASRALGNLITKVNIAGGMTYKVYNKLYIFQMTAVENALLWFYSH